MGSKCGRKAGPQPGLNESRRERAVANAKKEAKKLKLEQEKVEANKSSGD